LNSGGYFVNLLPFLAMRKEPPYKNSIQLFYTVHYKWFFSQGSLFLFMKKRRNHLLVVISLFIYVGSDF
ncbi:hypothetical protein, partial [Streptococcus ruminantium]|uniref:hypothetical protein n=1 Tax=Streptococcus ruminantium TaxID=1917441 RepID=UPI001D143D43